MSPITRNGDLSMGADGCCPIVAIGSSCPDVIIEGSIPLVVGNYFGRHPCGGKHCRHGAVCVAGNPRVLIHGTPLMVVGSRLSCDFAGTGACTVLAN